ncbi:MAG TPA: DUF6515 family protein [Daejeonella sp.]|nr:DUF6515 family protein [Daejeonella sp.]
MKSLSVYVFRLLLTGLLCLSFVSASAQRPSRGGGGRSGGMRPTHVSPGMSRGNMGRGTMGGTVRTAPQRFGNRPTRVVRPYGGYYRYYAPRLGIRVSFLPFGYFPFYYGPDLFYYYDGFFYRYYNDYYTVVPPPIGAEVPALPRGVRTITINGQAYFEKDGVYYKSILKPDGRVAYLVVGNNDELYIDDSAPYNNNNQQYTNPPDNGNNNIVQPPQVGDVVNALPPDSRMVTLKGDTFYVAPDGTYYQPITDQNNKTVYRVVGIMLKK